MSHNHYNNPYKQFHYTKHSTHLYITWKASLVIVVGIMVLAYGAFKLATHDYCPTYYGTTCLINK